VAVTCDHYDLSSVFVSLLLSPLLSFPECRLFPTKCKCEEEEEPFDMRMVRVGRGLSRPDTTNFIIQISKQRWGAKIIERDRTTTLSKKKNDKSTFS